ncbi:MAG: type II toxin-antitoxin system RelE/ParE family toxin [Anaerovoracaceae bacterium]
MIYRVEISPESLDLLMKHVAFLAQVSRDVAEKLRDDFKSQAQSLTRMPHRCPWLEGDYFPYRKYHKLIFGERYAIIYQVDEEAAVVHVDYVIDFRAEYSLLFR